MPSKPLTRLLVMAILAPTAWAGAIEGQVHATGSLTDRAGFVVSVEDIEAPPAEGTAVMDQKNLRFVPHVLAIQRGTTVEFPNNDPLSHNVFSISPAKRFNLGMYPQGESRSLKFDEAGVVEVLCNVHLEMSGFIVVLKNPYFAKTDAQGRFRISGIPAGKHRIRCWHESLPSEEREVEVPAKGTVAVNFKPGSEKKGGARE